MSYTLIFLLVIISGWPIGWAIMTIWDWIAEGCDTK